MPRYPKGIISALAPLLSCFPPIVAGQERYDVLIRNGRVLDGSGNPWFLADVAIQGERIAAVGNLSGASGRREVDAAGLYVAPGFIDSHSHAGPGLATAELSHGEPLLAQGLTMVMVNPDGGGPVDLSRQRSQLLEHGLGVNVALFVPHGSIRREIVGSGDRASNAAEMDQMKGAVRQGMEAGALALSSGTFYAPGSYSQPEEIRYYVVEEGVLDLAAALRSMTSLPAQVFRIPDRGTIREGAYADVVVFDLARVNDPATFTEPHQLAEGMVEVFVNGEAALSRGESTGLLPGRVVGRR